MADGPFAGLIVVDLTRVLAGPFCTMMLAEMGARVIKVETPQGDDARRFPPFLPPHPSPGADTPGSPVLGGGGQEGGQSGYFASLNRGKESIALDLKKDDDRSTFLAVVRGGDVLVENFRTGAIDRLGLGYDRLREVNPRLIYAAVSGFGQSGPWAQKPAYDLVVQALGGLMSVTGFPDGQPLKSGTSIGDITGGLFLLAGISAALYHRERTGAGMKVDVGMLDGQIAILESAVVRSANTGEVPGRLGNRHPSITPFELYATADRPLVIAAGNDALFSRLCQALGLPKLAGDPRFATNHDRTLNANALKGALEGALRLSPAEHWLKVMESAGVPCAPVQTVAEAIEHPQVRARNMIVEAGGLKMAGNPIKMSCFPDPSTRRAAPGLDADGNRLRQEFGV